MDKKFLEMLGFFLRGLFMGIADIIPGISGGTIAFITGIYERLIKAISSIDLIILTLFLKGKPKQSFNKIKEIDFALLIPLGVGILIAIFFLSKLITYLLTNHIATTFAFFFGLIIASAIFLFRKIHAFRFENTVFAAFGFIIAYVIAAGSTFQLSNSLLIIFLSGAFAICAMLLPGISGAFILLLLGQYVYLLTALHNYNLAVIGTFAAGALIGLLAFSKAIHHLLKNYHNLTLAFLTGLMLGSLRIPVIEITGNGGLSIGVLILGLIGFVLIFFVEHVSKRL